MDIISRREMLASCGAVISTATLAGCSDDDSPSDPNPNQSTESQKSDIPSELISDDRVLFESERINIADVEIEYRDLLLHPTQVYKQQNGSPETIVNGGSGGIYTSIYCSITNNRSRAVDLVPAEHCDQPYAGGTPRSVNERDESLVPDGSSLYSSRVNPGETIEGWFTRVRNLEVEHLPLGIEMQNSELSETFALYASTTNGVPEFSVNDIYPPEEYTGRGEIEFVVENIGDVSSAFGAAFEVQFVEEVEDREDSFLAEGDPFEWYRATGNDLLEFDPEYPVTAVAELNPGESTTFTFEVDFFGFRNIEVRLFPYNNTTLVIETNGK